MERCDGREINSGQVEGWECDVIAISGSDGDRWGTSCKISGVRPEKVIRSIVSF